MALVSVVTGSVGVSEATGELLRSFLESVLSGTFLDDASLFIRID
jgi:hypothetical protein